MTKRPGTEVPGRFEMQYLLLRLGFLRNLGAADGDVQDEGNSEADGERNVTPGAVVLRHNTGVVLLIGEEPDREERTDNEGNRTSDVLTRGEEVVLD